MAAAQIPLFLVRGGRLVRSTGPRAWQPIEHGPPDALRILRSAAPKDGLVYLWDVDGVASGAANHEFYQRLERERIFAWIDAGCRDAEDAMDAFFAGAEALTVRLDRMTPDRLRDFADIAEGEFHIGVRFPGADPDSSVPGMELRRLVGDLGANGIVLEAESGTDRLAFQRFGRLLTDGGVPLTVLSTEPLAWLPAAAAETAATRIVSPWGPPV